MCGAGESPWSREVVGSSGPASPADGGRVRLGRAGEPSAPGVRMARCNQREAE
jgi:hypothetical protein